MEKYLSAHDASRILDVTGNAVLLMAKRGELEVAAETESGIRLFRREDVERLAHDREAKRARSIIKVDVAAGEAGND
jgi:hypothetical protein